MGDETARGDVGVEGGMEDKEVESDDIKSDE